MTNQYVIDGRRLRLKLHFQLYFRLKQRARCALSVQLPAG